MYNPFVKLVSKKEEPAVEENPAEDYTNLTPSAEPMTPEEKQQRIAELRKWRGQVEAGMNSETHRDDAEQLAKIDEVIRKLEQ